jgi:hypothetical protein
VFVASQDDEADYRNAAAQNASLWIAIEQETLSIHEHSHSMTKNKGPISPSKIRQTFGHLKERHHPLLACEGSPVPGHIHDFPD